MIEGNFFGREPSNQNLVDLFQGQWSSVLPPYLGAKSGGHANLHEDDRIRWAGEKLGGFEQSSVLELGPLEAAHTAILERHGASSITGVEANAGAYMRCLVMKEMLDLKRSRFLLGDFVEYLRKTDEVFDMGIACGVLYHLRNPVEAIHLLSKHVRSLFVWTHYFDESLVNANQAVAEKFGGSRRVKYLNFEHTIHAYGYGIALDWDGFCGGGAETTNWMERAELLQAFEYFGFTKVAERAEPDHVNGPATWLAFKKSK